MATIIEARKQVIFKLIFTWMQELNQDKIIDRIVALRVQQTFTSDI